MRISHFSAVRCPGDWETSFISKWFQIRIGRSQFAIWLGYTPIISIGYGYGKPFLDGLWNHWRPAPPPSLPPSA